MDYLTCPRCGISSEVNTDVCTGCGQPLDSDVPTLASRKTEKSTEPGVINTNESDRRFGFGVSDLEFVQGVSVDAAHYLKKRFRPISPISKGGMGKLFLVQEVLSGRFVALKVMLESASSDVSLVHQFVREAVITARLQHPHIIPIYELGFLTEGQLYYTMRYVDGNTFDDVIHKTDLEERLRVLRSAATAVDHAHEQGLWHRDLKPNNILVGPLGDTYVIDWGLVSVQPKRDYRLNLPRIIIEQKMSVMPDNLLDETNKAVTLAGGKVIGTPAYMSPEQFEGDDSIMGAASDVWAFGVMLFEAITGRHPIENVGALRPHEILHRVLVEGLPAPRDISKDVPEALDNLCRRMLQKNASERMQTLKIFIEELTQYLKYQGKTIAGFGTFSELSKSRRESIETVGGREAAALKTTELNQYETKRLQKKVDLLLELAQLNILSRTRRKLLWRELGPSLSPIVSGNQLCNEKPPELIQRPCQFVAPHSGQSSQLALDATGGNAQLLTIERLEPAST